MSSYGHVPAPVRFSPGIAVSAGLMALLTILALPQAATWVQSPVRKPEPEPVAVEFVKLPAPCAKQGIAEQHVAGAFQLPAKSVSVPKIPVSISLAHDLPVMDIENPAGMDSGLDFKPDLDLSGGMDPDFYVFETGNYDIGPRVLSRINPVYPVNARIHHIAGHVSIEFTVTADGRAEKIRIIDSSPAGVFDGACLRAVGRWRFVPAMRNGKRVSSRVKVQLKFRLDGDER